jgi:hypothetical protein
MPKPDRPTLLYPNGGEEIFTSEITIRWTNSPVSGPTFIDVYFTDNFDPKDPQWKQITTLPADITSFVWRVGNIVKSNKVRVAVCSRNNFGQESDKSHSAADFSIRRKKLVTPSVLTPIPGSRHDKYIEIAPDTSALVGTYSQRSTYQMYYSSASANIPMTALIHDVPVDSDPILWNTVDLPPANDYKLSIFLQDDDDNKSDTLEIRDIQIAHEGVFYLDTTPPEAAIVINNGNQFTQSRDVTINVVSYDATTGVHAMQFIEDDNIANPEPPANVRPFTLTETDGMKTVELLLQDYGANRNDTTSKRLYQIVLDSTTVVDLAILPDQTAWAAVLSSSVYSLYKVDNFPQSILTFTDTPTCLGSFNSQLYAATKTGNLGTLKRYTGAGTLETIRSFSTFGSIITAMQQHGTSLYMGMENGSVYKYDGGSATLVDSIDGPVKSLSSDGISLFLVPRNDNKVYVFNGTTFEDTGAA